MSFGDNNPINQIRMLQTLFPKLRIYECYKTLREQLNVLRHIVQEPRRPGADEKEFKLDYFF